MILVVRILEKTSPKCWTFHRAQVHFVVTVLPTRPQSCFLEPQAVSSLNKLTKPYWVNRSLSCAVRVFSYIHSRCSVSKLMAESNPLSSTKYVSAIGDIVVCVSPVPAGPLQAFMRLRSGIWWSNSSLRRSTWHLSWIWLAFKVSTSEAGATISSTSSS